jgi:hypothetical protein
VLISFIAYPIYVPFSIIKEVIIYRRSSKLAGNFFPQRRRGAEEIFDRMRRIEIFNRRERREHREKSCTSDCETKNLEVDL